MFSLADSGARWIWPARFGEQVNQYVDFRQEFVVDQADPDAELLISADSNYAVWINDVFVDCGQYHDYPDRKTHDRLPIGSYLRRGSNLLVVTAHYQGEESFQYRKGPPGLIFALRGGGATAVSGTSTWYRPTPGYRQGPIARTSSQLGFTFEFDARADGEWSAIDDGDLAGVADARGLAPRPLEKLLLKPRAAAVVCAQGVFRRAGGVGHDDQSVAEIVQRDFLSARFPHEFFKSPAPLTLPSDAGVEVDPALLFADDGVYLVVDLGREDAGLLEIEVEADAGTCIDIAHGEHLDDLRVRAFVGGRNFASRYLCRDGRQSFTHPLSRLAGRFIQLHVSGGKTRFKLHYAGLRPAEYPVQLRGAFECPDSLNEQIYRTGIRTLHLCMHEHYEDCPWREQALYAFDARNQALCGYYGFGEYRFPAASFKLLGEGLKEDGYLEMCAPARIAITIPMFSFAWVLAVDDYWLYSAEPSFVRQMLPALQRMMRTHVARMERDLLPCPIGQRYWQFYEWAPGLHGSGRLLSPDVQRFDAPLNLMFCLALDAAARLSAAFDDQPAAAEFRAAAARLRSAIAAVFWDRAEGAYQTYVGADAPRHFAEFTQSLALLAGVPGSQTASRLRHRLTQPDNGMIATSLSHCHYKFEALLMDPQAHGRWVFQTIARDWGGMLRRGASSFWETIRGGDDFDQAGSLCHGWSAVPVYFYSAYLLGIRPIEPGFRRFTVDPVPGVVPSASGQVPTPFGTIGVGWEEAEGGIGVSHLSHPDQTQPAGVPAAGIEPVDRRK